MIGIIDIGIGTPKSILNALKNLNIRSTLIVHPKEIKKINKVILPGVGNFGYYMSRLRQKGFEEEIKFEIHENLLPFLGICVGAQAFLERSDESNYETGLDIFSGAVKKIELTEYQKVPNVGWREIEYKTKIFDLDLVNSKERYYFSHSFKFDVSPEFMVARTLPGDIPAIIQKNNVVGLQFHPEKSGTNGLNMLGRFANWKI